VFWALLPYVEGGNIAFNRSGLDPPPHPPCYESPADPTIQADPRRPILTSYAANAYVLHGSPTLPGSIPDGTSTTIAVAEHYAAFSGPPREHTFIYTEGYNGGFETRTHAFAHGGYSPCAYCVDVYPTTSGSPRQTIGSVLGESFQVAPPLSACNPNVAQTPHPAGMLVASFDGSVRILARDTPTSVYWALVTPDGGEVVSGY
jgi:hypothetical protein